MVASEIDVSNFHVKEAGWWPFSDCGWFFASPRACLEDIVKDARDAAHFTAHVAGMIHTRSPRLTSPLGIPMKNVGLRNAQQEVLRFSEFYKLRDADFRPNPVTHLRPWDGKLWHARQTSFSDSVRWLHHAGSIAIRGYDSLTINFTNAGSLTRAIRRGKHVEPLCKILPSCRMVPVKAGLPDAMMRPRYPSEPSLGLDAGRAQAAQVVNRTTFYRCRKLPNWTV
eukprot:s234_g18.t4